MSGQSQNLAWITGTNGLIGNYLVQTAPLFAKNWRLRTLTRADFDLLDFAAVRREFVKDRPQLVIHCAAMTAVADAQKNPKLARRVNVEATKLLAALAAEIPFAPCANGAPVSDPVRSPDQSLRAVAETGAPTSFVFFSTDLVFDGRKGNYTETDAPNPLHVYGETKAAAEEIVLKNPRHLVVRTSLNGGISPCGRAFNEQLRRSLQSAGQGMKLFTDEFRCPIPAVETARTAWELVNNNCAGLYHVAGAEKLSRWQIGELLIRRWPEVTAKIEAALARDFAGPPRALDTSLNIDKVQKVLSVPLPGFGEWLAKNPGEKF